MEEIIIRRAKNSDAEEWYRLALLVGDKAYAHIFPPTVSDEKTREADEKMINEKVARFKSRTLNKDGNISFVAVANKKMVALLDAFTLSGYDHYKELGYAELEGIYIHPDYQGRGLGAKLFNKTKKELVKLGCDKMMIGVLEQNTQARAVYEKWGGKLDTSYRESFIRSNREYFEVFYLYQLT